MFALGRRDRRHKWLLRIQSTLSSYRSNRPKPVNAYTELIVTKQALAVCDKLIGESPLRGAAMTEQDFYPKHQDYWERVNDNLARWLGPATSDHGRCLHSLAAGSATRASHRLVDSVGGLVLAREDTQSNQRALSAVLRFRVVALSRALVAGTTCRRYWCRTVRHSSEGRR